MSKAAVGGSPETISAGAAALASAASTIGQTAVGISEAGRQGVAAAAQDPLDAAIERFAAACSQTSRDLETEMLAAATLASNSGSDLAAAGGNGPR